MDSDSDSFESNTINQKETGDTPPQTLSGTSSNEYPLAAPETCTMQANNLNEKIPENSGNPLVLPPSSNFPSGTSGDSQKESSTSATTQYDVTSIKVDEEGVIGQFTVSEESKFATPETSKNQAIIIEDALAEEGIVKNDTVISDHPIVDVNPPDVHSPFIGETLVPLHSPNALMEHESTKDRSKEQIQQEGSEHEEEEKKGDGVHQTSSDFPSGTPGDVPNETCTIQSTSMTEKIQDSNSSLLVVPTSSNFPSGTSAPPSSTTSPSDDEPQKSSVAAAEQQTMAPLEEYAAFRDIGLIKKKNILLLEQAIEIYPSLWTWQNRYEHPRMKQIGYRNLGDMLEFLATTRWRDLTEGKKAEFESLVEVMKSLGFDIQWLDRTLARIKESKIDEGTIIQMKTLQVKKAELEAQLHKVKMELASTESELETITSELGNLDDFCWVDALPN